jgi:hypothetical protein
MDRHLQDLILPTFRLLAVLLAANVILCIFVSLLSGSSPLVTLVDAWFLESGFMMVLGALIMFRTPRIESKGSKILLGGTILFILDVALGLILSMSSLG